jgi:hypothetical protein
VRELHTSLDAREFAEWQAFDQLEPIGAPAAELRTGILAANIANAAPERRRSKPFVPKDFMPHLAREEKLVWASLGFDRQADIVAERLLARFGTGRKKET